MNILKRLKNVCKPNAQSYNILKKEYNFKFIEKFYKTPFYSLCVYLTILISSFLVFMTYFTLSQNRESIPIFMLFLFLYNFTSIMSLPAIGHFFLKKISKDILFKFTRKYDVLVNIDEKRKQHILDQEELKRFVKNYIIHDEDRKAKFALFLSKKKYKAISKYDVIHFLEKNTPFCLSDGIKETRNLYEEHFQEFPVKKSYKERKIEKGLEIIEHLASDKKISLDKDNKIIISNEYNKYKEEVK